MDPGEPITSRQYLALARAFNDRLKSGVGDGSWRIFYALHSLFRSLRNFVSEDDFWALRQGIDPASGREWPAALPGQPSGANTTNPLAAFVFGAAGFGLAAESERLLNLPTSDNLALSDAEAWALGSAQCGAYDPDTGAMGAPAFKAARAHFAIAYGPSSQHGRTFGGYLPNPTATLSCQDPDPGDDIPAAPNYEIFFTSTVLGLDGSAYHGTVTTTGDGYTRITYDGTCRPAPGDDYPTHIAGIVEMPWASYVRLNNGTVDELPASLWVQGPYEGVATLKRPDLTPQRVLHTYAREFRGTDAQRAEADDGINSVPWEEFLRRQYLLSPVLGVKEGTNVRVVETVFEWTASAASGSLAKTVSGRRTQHAVHPEFCVALLYVSGTGILEPTTVVVLDGAKECKRLTITPESEEVSAIIVLDPALVAPKLGFRLGDRLRLNSSGRLSIEIREQLTYKPLTHDAYLMARVMSGGTYPSNVDGRGLDEPYAREAGERYLQQGCLINWHQSPDLPEAFAAINTNAVFDSARRWSRFCRVIRRNQIHGYAVTGGKSILWIRRWAVDPEGGDPIDCMDGIGPSREDIVKDTLQIGRTYVVRTGSVVHAKKSYSAGQTFDASESTWSGGGAVREYSGVVRTAPQGGLTNAWVVNIHLRPYHPSETSDWDVATWTDNTTIFNRCHFGSPEISNDRTTLWHFAFGRRTTGTYGGVLIPETPPGYNYAPLSQSWLGRTSINETDCGPTPSTQCLDWRKAFYRSCRVYEPPAEIESAVAETGTGGIELVKLTFTGRLHHAPEAPASISSDASTWSMATLATESFRSIENGIREYIIHSQYGGHCTPGDLPAYTAGGPSGQPGNAAANTSFYAEPDDPFGTCYPTLVFTQLVPEPHEDGNTSANPGVDSKFLHDPMTQMDLYLRAMAEGWVDGETSTDYACRLGVYSVFDFSFESLCQQAFGARWMSPLPTNIRDDRGEGFGPVPAVGAYAQVFNQFVEAINLLDRARIMLPMQLEFATSSTTENQPIAVQDPTGAPEPCTGGAQVVQVDAQISDPPIDWSSPTWVTGSPIDAIVSAELDGSCDGSDWNLVVSREDVRFRWQPTDPDAIEAIPPDLRPHLEDNPVVLAKVTKLNVTIDASLVSDINASEPCCFVFQAPCPGVWSGGGGKWWSFPGVVEETITCLDSGGELRADILAPGYVAYAQTPSGAVCKIGPSNRSSIQVISDGTSVVSIPLVALA